MSVNLRMSFLDQMKLWGLIDLCLMLILVSSNSKGVDWNITVPELMETTLHSNVTIQCTFTYPIKFFTPDVKLYWKRREKSSFNTYDNDQYQFAYHPNETFVVDKYKGKTRLIGNKDNGSCSLKIENVLYNETSLYVRILLNGENYSFSNYQVSIFVSGPGAPESGSEEPKDYPTFTPGATTTEEPDNPSLMYVAIFVPVSALLIVILIIAIFCSIKRKRPQSFTREESGYYANFSRTSSNQTQRIQTSLETSCKNHENKKLPALKAIDEPVYANTQALTSEMHQSMDHRDNVYANVDCTK